MWKLRVADVIQVDEHGGEEVLTGVLLHVVESATPIDLALDLRERKRLLEDMNDPPILIENVGDGQSTDASGVVRLTARCRIESRLVQHYAQTAFKNARPEGSAIRIFVIKATCLVAQWNKPSGTRIISIIRSYETIAKRLILRHKR